MKETAHGGIRGELSTEIREALARRRRSQDWLARQAGVSPYALSRMLTGSTEQTLAVWEEVCRAAGLKIVVVRRDPTEAEE